MASVENSYVLARLLQCKRTGHYWGNQGWTPDQSMATNFANAGVAISTCLSHQLSDVEFVIHAHGFAREVFRAVLR